MLIKPPEPPGIRVFLWAFFLFFAVLFSAALFSAGSRDRDRERVKQIVAGRLAGVCVHFGDCAELARVSGGCVHASYFMAADNGCGRYGCIGWGSHDAGFDSRLYVECLNRTLKRKVFAVEDARLFDVK